MRTMGKVKATAVRVGAAMAAVTAGVGVFSVKEALSFGKGMREIQTITGQTDDELKVFGDQIKAVSQEIGVGLKDSVEAMYKSLSSGIPTDNAIDFLRVGGKAAVGGVTDLTTATGGLIRVMNAYGAENVNLSKVADVFFETIRIGDTRFGELSESIGKVGAIASAAGVSFEELFAGFATLTKQTGDTDLAATALKATLTQLLKPNPKLAAVLKDVTDAEKVASWQALGLQKTLKLVAKEVNNDSSALTKLFPNVRALAAIYGTTGTNAEAAAFAVDTMTNASGKANAAFETMSKDASFKLGQVKTQFQIIAVEIGDNLIPKVLELSKMLAGFAKGENVDSLVDSFTAIAAVIAIAAKLFLGLVTMLRKFTMGPLGDFAEKVARVMEKLGLAGEDSGIAKLVASEGETTSEDVALAKRDRSLRLAREARGITAPTVGPLAREMRVPQLPTGTKIEALVFQILEHMPGMPKAVQ